LIATERTLDRQFAEWDLFPVAVVLGVVMLLILTLGGGEDGVEPANQNPVTAPAEKTEGG
jgi:hypothetical protein